MQIRYKGPEGAGKIEIDDGATVGQLVDALKASTGLVGITVKYGWPPKALETDQYESSIQELNLQRESLTIAPAPTTSTDAAITTAPVPSQTSRETSTMAPGYGDGTIKDKNISVPMPETGSTLVLRVMPDDNSCLFTAVSGALRGLRSAADHIYTADELRRIVTTYILEHPDDYNAAILNMEPIAYCHNMRQPDTWGGGIELGIISELFEIEISTVDVQTTKALPPFGEGKGYESRCFLVYSNVHYDRLAEVFFDGQEEMDFDVTCWAADNCDHIAAHAKELCRILRDDHHYYTSTSDFVVRCDECDWIGQGQDAVIKHMRKTGHKAVTEMKIT